MTIRINPYPQYLTDNCSGLQVLNMKHQIWAEGYQAGKKARKVIKTVIKSQSDMVIAFDAKGEQIPEYQGQYQDAKEPIMKDALPTAVFAHWFNHTDKPTTVAKEKW